MAACSQCGTNVGCACHLIAGVCMTCYNKNLGTNGDGEQTLFQKKRPKKVIHFPSIETPPNTEFTEILQNTALSREEKLKRINNILEKARIDINDNQS